MRIIMKTVSSSGLGLNFGDVKPGAGRNLQFRKFLAGLEVNITDAATTDQPYTKRISGRIPLWFYPS
jgi:hypothetical protein